MVYPAIDTPFVALEVKNPHNEGIPYVEEELSIEGRIRATARRYEVDEELAVSIIMCESGFNPNAKNGSSTASGYWQFIRSTWKETIRRMELPEDSDVFDGEINLEAGMWLLSTDGTSHWLASKNCWNRAGSSNTSYVPKKL